jgi:hypothetical protein
MTDWNPNVSFQARRLARAPGWYVRVEWPNGRCDHIPGFVTQHEAQRWIDQKGEAWANEANTPEVTFRPRSRNEALVRSGRSRHYENGTETLRNGASH